MRRIVAFWRYAMVLVACAFLCLLPAVACLAGTLNLIDQADVAVAGFDITTAGALESPAARVRP